MPCDVFKAENCSITAEWVCPNSDVSGIGVILGYTINAGMVVIIIAGSYLLGFDPEADPFGPDEADGGDARAGFRPNPIDILFIGWLKKTRLRGRKSSNKRMEVALMKCVLAMSDLQILTGLSILISGAVQLPSGISRFHWQILVHLAWFSSLTHFGCLSFLRRYLAQHRAERVWRLFFMAVIVIMLAFALVPTGLAGKDDFTYPSSRRFYGKKFYGRPMICALKQATSADRGSAPFANMVLSITLLAGGLLVRLVKLSEQLSGFTTNRFRKPCSGWAIRWLARVHAWSNIIDSPLGWRRLLVYRPLLACFLLTRVVVDLYASMLIEVLWIVLSFIWGLLQLIHTLEGADGGKDNWSFGQIVPIILTGAPLLTFYESFCADHTASFSTSSSSIAMQPTITSALYSSLLATSSAQSGESRPGMLSSSPHSAIFGEIPDAPEHEFYHASTWFPSLMVIPFTVLGTITGVSYLMAISGNSIFADGPALVLLSGWALASYACMGVSYILFALLLEHHKGNVLTSLLSRRIAVIMRVSLLVLSPALMLISPIIAAGTISVLVSIPLLLYVVICIGLALYSKFRT